MDHNTAIPGECSLKSRMYATDLDDEERSSSQSKEEKVENSKIIKTNI